LKCKDAIVHFTPVMSIH